MADKVNERLNVADPEGSLMVRWVGETTMLYVASRRVMVIASVPVKPLLSLTEAVMVCIPADRSDRVKEPPVPRVPSKSDSQKRLAVKSPSSASVALPLKVMFWPSV